MTTFRPVFLRPAMGIRDGMHIFLHRLQSPHRSKRQIQQNPQEGSMTLQSDVFSLARKFDDYCGWLVGVVDLTALTTL